MKPTTKRYLVSTLLTFATGFAISLLANIEQLNLEAFISGAYIGILFSAVRTGIKVVLEAFVAWRTSKQ